jgi:hypothetical protein
MASRRLRRDLRWRGGRADHAHARRSEGEEWRWSLAYGYHRDRTPTFGYEPTREAAMTAFAKSWRRQ